MPIGFTRFQGFGNRFTSSLTEKKTGPDLQVAKRDETCIAGNQQANSQQCKPRLNLTDLLFSPFQNFLYRLRFSVFSRLGLAFSLSQKPALVPNPITSHSPTSIAQTDKAPTFSNFVAPDQSHLEPFQEQTSRPQSLEIDKKSDNPFALSKSPQSPSSNQIAFKPTGQLLWESIRAGDSQTIQRFVKLGVNVNTPWGKYGRTPLQEAVFLNDLTMVKTLLAAKHLDVNASDRMGLRAIDIAVIHNQPDIVNALLDKGANLEASNHELPLTNSPLYLAVLLGERDMVRLLIQRHANVNGRSLSQDTPLHCAVTCRRKNIVENLLAHGADISARNQYGQTPLHRAASSGDPKIMALLLAQEKADPNAQDDMGRSPLHYAALNDHLQIVKLLTAHQADFDLKDQRGETPRNILMKRRKIRAGRENLPNLERELLAQAALVSVVSS